MLDAYLNLKHRRNDWFDGLRISELRPNDPDKNSYPVIYQDMKELDTASFESFLDDVRLQISLECMKHQEIPDSDKINHYDREIFRSLLTGSSEDAYLRRFLYMLSIS